MVERLFLHSSLLSPSYLVVTWQKIHSFHWESCCSQDLRKNIGRWECGGKQGMTDPWFGHKWQGCARHGASGVTCVEEARKFLVLVPDGPSLVWHRCEQAIDHQNFSPTWNNMFKKEQQLWRTGSTWGDTRGEIGKGRGDTGKGTLLWTQMETHSWQEAVQARKGAMIIHSRARTPLRAVPHGWPSLGWGLNLSWGDKAESCFLTFLLDCLHLLFSMPESLIKCLS